TPPACSAWQPRYATAATPKRTLRNWRTATGCGSSTKPGLSAWLIEAETGFARLGHNACAKETPREVMTRLRRAMTSRGFDLEDLVLHRAAGRRHLDRLALLVPDDCLADRRFVRELVLRRVRLG